MNPKIIGIGGYARCGKDTFVKIAKNVLRKNGYTPFRVAFADVLKEEVAQMLRANNFPLDVYTDKIEEKTQLRPLLVWWGCARRNMTKEGLYWVNEASEYIDDVVSDNYETPKDRLVALVSDVRFPNEAQWIHDNNGWFIHLKRYNLVDTWPNGQKRDDDIYRFDPAPNEEEAKQDPLIQKMADYMVEWENKGKLTPEDAENNDYLYETVLKTLNACPFFNGKVLS